MIQLKEHSVHLIHKTTCGTNLQSLPVCQLRLLALTPPLTLTVDPWLLPYISRSRKAQSPFTVSLTCSAVRALDRGEAKYVEKIEAPHILPITKSHGLFCCSFFASGNISGEDRWLTWAHYLRAGPTQHHGIKSHFHLKAKRSLQHWFVSRTNYSVEVLLEGKTV